ncbi:SDR family oxidoreductase [Candidatus Woesebacteria bacterium]|nr:SDR family oxidoreductase [Candidatus Woesebacteria bacterium]
MNKNKRVLVTGGAGFIGSHLCAVLIEDGYRVVSVDNLITGSRKNIEQLISNKNFEFLKKDIVKDSLGIKKADYIFHLASPASPLDYQKYPEETALTNSLGTINMLELAKKTSAKFLLASTSEVYGDPEEHPQKETYWGNVNSFGPRSCYDESKRFAEAMTYIYLHKYALDARVVRIFNTYGPKMRKDDGRAVSNFINQAISEKPLTVNGDGNQTRSFCYVEDMVEGFMKAMFSTKAKGEVINLGNPEEYNILDLAEKIKKMTGSKSKIVFSALPPNDPGQRRPDISKAKKLLGWSPKVSLTDGLKKTIEYYKSL